MILPGTESRLAETFSPYGGIGREVVPVRVAAPVTDDEGRTVYTVDLIDQRYVESIGYLVLDVNKKAHSIRVTKA
jgi:hypothetical protein